MSGAKQMIDDMKRKHAEEFMKNVVECKDCGGSGFSKAGTGYDSVCDKCGGFGRHLK